MGELPEEFMKTFRTQQIHPTINDIDYVQCLPLNLEKGSYKSEDHYLDTQFHLLREDFIYPLRKAIQYYRKNRITSGTNLVCNKVLFDGSREFFGNKLGFVITFDPNLYNINLFINGFLLLFSKDDFTTFFVGLVLKDDKEYLKKGILLVEMLGDIDIRPNTILSMGQCEQFYVPYNWTLKALQQMHSQTFPLKEYIVFASNKPCAPEYLNDSNTQKYDIDDYKFNILKDDEWPTEIYLQQEHNQYKAFKAALTQKYVLIQGVPGTGKTYIGQKIVKVMIENLYTTGRLKNPIAVICNNNHTLDHFLEGVLKITDKLVRIGCQSKCEALKKYSLKEIVKLNKLKIDNVLEQELKVKEQAILKCYEECDKLYTDSWDFLNWLFHPYPVDKMIKNYKRDDVVSNQHCLILDDIKQCLLKLTEQVTEGSEYHSLKIKQELKMLKKFYEYFEYMLAFDDSNINSLIVNDIHLIPADQRWVLYYNWVQRIVNNYKNMLTPIWKEYNELCKKLDQNRLEQTVNLLKNIHIIGLTTTGAVKNKDLLEHLKPPIVIVEEGTEALEPYIVSSLTEHVQHLILIGDQKVERPKTTYNLAKMYNFNQTLMERTLNNGLPLNRLTKQFRMRPEIMSLVLPFITDQLESSDHTCNLLNVAGITKNVYFIDHNVIEECNNKNHTNLHELKFIIELARYLCLQNYKPEEIMILTSHKDQVHELIKHKQESLLIKNIYVSSVDNCSLPECEIVLLSTVHSNKEDSGFWKHENRICSALTKAKIGLYIIGNMDNLINQCELWNNVKTSLQSLQSIGSELTLECSIHKGTLSKVSKAEDFINRKCPRPCLQQLKCNHYCQSICHTRDREHIYMFKCRNINCRSSKSLIRFPLRDIFLLFWEYTKNIIYEVINQPI
ncbi:Hypothetical protein CINCED_3A013372 [Cinara cedri]|uniref:P-loop containing nucleoside triphosphate hydrolase n=1 Tax=Cinara cedri TaxID=506608 RepID=A0A5E4NHM5_9HEMI|nr:Hypothetical protein CINCED_3A013372 [Cinara cedri]